MLGRQLAADECKVPILKFNSEQAQCDWQHLFDCVVTAHTKVADLKKMIVRMLKERYAVNLSDASERSANSVQQKYPDLSTVFYYENSASTTCCVSTSPAR